MKYAKTLARTVCIVASIIASLVLPVHAQKTDADTAEAARIVRSFHQALAAGDSKAVVQLLASDAVVLESGGLETREEYLSHHLATDLEFAQAVSTRRSPIQVTVSGDVAWASSTSETEGQYRKREVNVKGAELLVLSKSAKGWMIRAIHWSSRPRS